MEHGNNKHKRRLVAVNIGEEINKDREEKVAALVDHILNHTDAPLAVSLEELAMQCGIQTKGLVRFSPENN